MNISEESEAKYAREKQALEKAREVIRRKYFWPKLISGSLFWLCSILLILILAGY